MKRNNLYLIAIGLGLTVATACNNEAKTQDNAKVDTVVVEKNTTTTVEKNTQTSAPSAATEPSTNVTVNKNGTSVTTKSTDVKVNKDGVSFQKK